MCVCEWCVCVCEWFVCVCVCVLCVCTELHLITRSKYQCVNLVNVPGSLGPISVADKEVNKSYDTPVSSSDSMILCARHIALYVYTCL